MQGGIIIVEKARGDIHFLSRSGQQVFSPMHDVEVKINREFAGVDLKDAIKEAKRFAEGALKLRVQQKLRGKFCFPVVRSVDVSYKIKFGFGKDQALQRELEFAPGERILKKGDYGKEIFLIKEGTVEADRVIYRPGDVFGRAAFADCIRKRDVYAKTWAKVIAIDKAHPEILKKLPALLEKFDEEKEMIHKVRPRARLDRIKV